MVSNTKPYPQGIHLDLDFMDWNQRTAFSEHKSDVNIRLWMDLLPLLFSLYGCLTELRPLISTAGQFRLVLGWLNNRR